jgi:hypothetical protein
VRCALLRQRERFEHLRTCSISQMVKVRSARLAGFFIASKAMMALHRLHTAAHRRKVPTAAPQRTHMNTRCYCSLCESIQRQRPALSPCNTPLRI